MLQETFAQSYGVGVTDHTSVAQANIGAGVARSLVRQVLPRKLLLQWSDQWMDKGQRISLFAFLHEYDTERCQPMINPDSFSYELYAPL